MSGRVLSGSCLFQAESNTFPFILNSKSVPSFVSVYAEHEFIWAYFVQVERCSPICILFFRCVINCTMMSCQIFVIWTQGRISKYLVEEPRIYLNFSRTRRGSSLEGILVPRFHLSGSWCQKRFNAYAEVFLRYVDFFFSIFTSLHLNAFTARLFVFNTTSWWFRNTRRKFLHNLTTFN